ncbi:hypothetical protein GO011_08240 [Mycobacterium sp. 20091114027_K0903767]|nr:hypothetical protein [Mycobacterium sp. 20091114027_K0903767]
MSARLRSATAAVRSWILNPVTWVATVLVAVAAGVALLLAPAHDDVAGPPARIESTAKVGGYCAVIVSGFDGAVWALAPGSRDGDLKRVDAADVNRHAPECQPLAATGTGERSGR